MSNHKTVKLKPPSDLAPLLGHRAIDIDAKLGPLIRLLWAAGLPTEFSCEEYWPGLAWIAFYGTQEVEAFLGIAQRDYKVEGKSWDATGRSRRGPFFRVQLSVSFPAADIPYLVKAFAGFAAVA